MKLLSRGTGVLLVLIGAVLFAVTTLPSADAARILAEQTAAAVEPAPTTDVAPVAVNRNDDSKLAVSLITQGAGAKDDYPLCTSCVEFASKSINYLLNAILNDGVMATCGQLCSFAPGPLEQQVCTMVCDVVGIAGFVKAVNSADLDVIYLCEQLNKGGVTVCPVKHCPEETPECVVPGELTLKPKRPKVDASVVATLPIHTVEPVGTSMVLVELCKDAETDPAKKCASQAVTRVGWPVGDYDASLKVQTAGLTAGAAYTLSVEVCDGTCGSKHGHSFGKKEAKFTLRSADAVEVKEEPAAAAVVEETKTETAATLTDAVTPVVEATLNPVAALKAHFAQWMAEHGKKYDTAEEEEKRMGIFAANKKFVERHNAEHAEGKHSHWVGLNHLADLTAEEFRNMLGYKRELLDARPPVDPTTWEYASVTPPESVDWVEKGAVTPVKNQGQCGSCWAFSTTGAVEGVHQIKTGKLVAVSEEELVSCSHNGNMGCNGGLMDNAFKWIIKNKGIDTEEDWKYTAKVGKCGFVHRHRREVSITGFKDVPSEDEDSLEKAVAMQPVAVAIEADHQSFQLYKGGVYAAKDCGTSLDHGVLVVGYGMDPTIKGHKHFWKIKNSWGPGWGEEGFIRISKGGKSHGKRGQCGVTMQASYPTISADAPDQDDSLLHRAEEMVKDAVDDVVKLATA